MAKTYDCFLFFNEFDLLELRLRTLWDAVDTFVLVESPWTFSGKKKPLHYCENKDRFSEWADKIKVVVASGTPSVPDPWVREYLSRECMHAGFKDAEPDDLIFQSDLDEIWRPEKKEAGHPTAKVVVYQMFHAYYYLNTKRVPEHIWNGTRRCRFKDYPGGQKMRQVWGPRIPDGGWHFSFLGDAKAAKTKLEAYAHTEYADLPLDHIEESIGGGIDLINPTAKYVPVPIDDSFPKPILEDPERWRPYVR